VRAGVACIEPLEPAQRLDEKMARDPRVEHARELDSLQMPRAAATDRGIGRGRVGPERAERDTTGLGIEARPSDAEHVRAVRVGRIHPVRSRERVDRDTARPGTHEVSKHRARVHRGELVGIA
jgi:hypothetical protein